MKINSTYVWSNLVAVPVLFSIITYLFYRGNTDAYDYVDTYLKQSKVIKLTIPQKYERKSEFYSFRFGKNGNRKYNQFIFYSAEYKKYLAIMSFSGIDTFGEIDIEDLSIEISLQSLLMPIPLSGTMRSMAQGLCRCRYSLSRPLTCTTTN